jgi:hypothetical protein
METDFICTDCEDTGQIEYELLCGHDGVRYEYRDCTCVEVAEDSDDESNPSPFTFAARAAVHFDVSFRLEVSL